MRHGYSPGPEVGDGLPVTRPTEVQDGVRWAVHPFQALAGLQFRRSSAPAGYSREWTPGHPPGPARERTEPGGLRQVRAAPPKPKDGPRGPRQRHPAAVAPFLRAAGAPEDGSCATVGGRSRDLVQAELLALVEVGRAGQREHQQGGGPGPAEPELDVSAGRAVAEQPASPSVLPRRPGPAARSGWRAGRRRGWTAPRWTTPGCCVPRRGRR